MLLALSATSDSFASWLKTFEKEVSIIMSVATKVAQVDTSCPLNMVVEQSRTAEEPASDENAVGSRRAAWRIVARTERAVTSETVAGEGTLVNAEGLHADTLRDVSITGIYKIVFAGRVEHGIVKFGECPGDNEDLNIKDLDKNNMACSGDVVCKKDTTLGQTREREDS